MNDKSATCAKAGIDVNDKRTYVKTSSITEHEVSAMKGIRPACVGDEG